MEDFDKLSHEDLSKIGVDSEKREPMDNLELRKQILELIMFIRNKDGLLNDEQKETLRKLSIIAGVDLGEKVEKSRSVLEETKI